MVRKTLKFIDTQLVKFSIALFFVIWGWFFFFANPNELTDIDIYSMGDNKISVEVVGDKARWATRFCRARKTQTVFSDSHGHNVAIDAEDSTNNTNKGDNPLYVTEVDIPAVLDSGTVYIHQSIIYRCFGYVDITTSTETIEYEYRKQ